MEPLHHATHATHQPAKKGFRKNTELPWAALEIRMVKGTFELFENVLIFHFISFNLLFPFCFEAATDDGLGDQAHLSKVGTRSRFER